MKHSPEIERIIRETIDALERSDTQFIGEITSRQRGVVTIGSDPEEYQRGHDEILAMMDNSTPEGPLHIHVRVGDVHAYEHGDIGWADGTGAFERDGDSVEVRLTAVFERENGKWRMVQNHASIGVPNDRMFDKVYARPKAASGG